MKAVAAALARAARLWGFTAPDEILPRPRAVAAFLSAAMMAGPAAAECDSLKESRKPTAQYQFEGDRVYDTQSGLTWQRCSVGQAWNGTDRCEGKVTAFSIAEAALYTEEGWRIPTQNELATLVSPTCFDPAINEEVFPDMDRDVLGYWSRSFDSKKRVWYINFVDGTFRTYSGTTFRLALRLVKE